MAMGLPRDETAFFGRDAEIAEIERRFAAGARLVTVVGIGGVGKTRLAIEAAARLAGAPSSATRSGRIEASVAFVALSGAKTIEAAVRAVAAAVGARVSAESKAAQALEGVADAIAKRDDLLIVLDDVTDAALVDTILERARKVKLLATAREPTGVNAEEKIVLAPLSEDDALALFGERARAAVGGEAIELLPDEAKAIVNRVDRLPLAIEIAASRLQTLTPKELLDRMSRATSTTMHATLDQSWELLSDVERSALVQISVFPGPFGIEAAEEVLALPNDADVLDVVEALLEKSLVTRAERRLRLFETVRSWARAKGDTKEPRARHARWAFAEAARWAAKSYGTEGVRALDELTVLLPDVVAAFEATRDDDPRAAAEGVLSLTDVLLFRGLFELRADVLARAVETAEKAKDPRVLARALVAKARVTLEVGKMADAEAELRRALELAAAASDDVTRAEALRSLGWALTAMGRLDEAETALETAKRMHREQGSARGEADAHVALGILRAFQGKADVALGHLREALGIHVERGDVVRQEKVLGFAPLVGQDAREVARGLPREVLARAPEASLDRLPEHVASIVATEREAGERWRHAIALYRDGASAHARGDHAAAIDAFDRAFTALGRTGVTRGLAVVHAHAAVAFADSGDPKEAEARLARAKEAVKSDPASELAVALHEAAVMLARGKSDEVVARARAVLARAERAEASPPEVLVARNVVAARLGDKVPSDANALVVGADARWMIPPEGGRVDLVRYGPVRRLLDRLVNERLEKPGNALSAEQLIEAGWPGERMRHSAGLLRVYSAIRRLRRLGLEPVLVTRDDGYLIDPHAGIRREGT